uniref:Bee-milk protein n=1 Tax=Arion vulgaris TaxID=1028688 RepID=A0A0B6ZHW7_9EUPU
MVSNCYILLVTMTTICVMCWAGTTSGSGILPSEVMYEWIYVDFDWPSEAVKQQYQQDGRYDRTHNLISGIKTYKGNIYVSVPRLKYTTGVPSTLNIVVQKGNTSVLRPFPDWASQQLGNCSALQCAMSMEVDPITGYMYVIDPGRSGIFGNISNQTAPTICPPKLVVYDLKDGRLVRSHDFPEDLVSNQTNFLNDIVLDRGNATSTVARWVYITDAVDSKLISFDLETNVTFTVQHSSMDYDEDSNITVNGKTYTLKTPIDGLAMSADFQYVYYCALGSKKLYQVPARVLRSKDQNFAGNVRYVGPKISQTGGMTCTSDNLYYGALTRNGVYRWEMIKDEKSQGVSAALVKMETETEIVHDDQNLQWPDSFTVDEYGYLWFTACRAQLFLLGGIDFTGTQGSNYRIWRVKISESSYLAPPHGSSNLLQAGKSIVVSFMIAFRLTFR